MNKNDLQLMALLEALNTKGYLHLSFNEEDFKYMNNSKVQDIIFDFYMDLLRLSTIDNPVEQELFVDQIAEKFNTKIVSFNQEEQDYIKSKLYEVLQDREDEPKKLNKRKEND